MENSLAVKKEEKDLSVLDRREKIFALEEKLKGIDGAVIGDSEQMPLKHTFADGIYVREIFIPKGFILTGKIHKHSHPNFLMKGEVLVYTEGKGKERLKAPLSIISAPGTKRAVFALEDTTWITVHATKETDLEKIEDYVIAKSYDDTVLTENVLSLRNCLILALKQKGRDYCSLLTLKSVGHLLPFKDALSALKENGVSLDGLYATKKGSEWHVDFSGDESLENVKPGEGDIVGSWVAVGVGAGTAVGAVGSSMLSNNQDVSQGPMQTDEQIEASRKLFDLAYSGKLGQGDSALTLGENLGLPKGNFNLSPQELQAMGSIQGRFGSGTPEALNKAISTTMDFMNDPTIDPAGTFKPFKTRLDRELRDRTDALKRNASAMGNLYSSSTIQGFGDVQARGQEVAAEKLAGLTNQALDRRLSAAELGANISTLPEDIQRRREGDMMSAGGLERNLYNQGINQQRTERLRRRDEELSRVNALSSVLGANTQFGVKDMSVFTPSPFQGVLQMAAQLGGDYLSNRWRGGGGSGGGRGAYQPPRQSSHFPESYKPDSNFGRR